MLATLWVLLGSVGLAAPADPSAASTAAPEVEAAARILSRFPAGHIPATTTTLSAIADLARAGGEDELSLIDSLIREEHAAVQAAAISARNVLASGPSHVVMAPSPEAVDAWLAGSRFDATPGAQQRAVATYTALLLGGRPPRPAPRDPRGS